MKKFFKYLISLITAVLILAIVGIGVVVYRLPSAGEIKDRLSGGQSQPGPKNEKKETRISQEKEGNPKLAPEDSGALPKNSEITEQKKPIDRDKVIEELIFDSQRPLANVCDHLRDAASSPMFPVDQKPDFFKDIANAAAANPDDPFANALFAPVRFAIRLPHAKSFFDEIREAEANGGQNLMQKVGFYAKGLAAYNEIQANNKLINDVSNYSYYLFLMGQVVKQNPQLSQSPEAQEYCHQIQQNLSEGLPFNADDASEEMLKFLDYAHVTPEQVKFDPEFRSDMKVEFNRQGFMLGFGWVGKYLVDQPSSAPKADR